MVGTTKWDVEWVAYAFERREAGDKTHEIVVALHARFPRAPKSFTENGVKYMFSMWDKPTRAADGVLHGNVKKKNKPAAKPSAEKMAAINDAVMGSVASSIDHGNPSRRPVGAGAASPYTPYPPHVPSSSDSSHLPSMQQNNSQAGMYPPFYNPGQPQQGYGQGPYQPRYPNGMPIDPRLSTTSGGGNDVMGRSNSVNQNNYAQGYSNPYGLSPYELALYQQQHGYFQGPGGHTGGQVQRGTTNPMPQVAMNAQNIQQASHQAMHRTQSGMSNGPSGNQPRPPPSSAKRDGFDFQGQRISTAPPHPHSGHHTNTPPIYTETPAQVKARMDAATHSGEKRKRQEDATGVKISPVAGQSNNGGVQVHANKRQKQDIADAPKNGGQGHIGSSLPQPSVPGLVDSGGPHRTPPKQQPYIPPPQPTSTSLPQPQKPQVMGVPRTGNAQSSNGVAPLPVDQKLLQEFKDSHGGRDPGQEMHRLNTDRNTLYTSQGNHLNQDQLRFFYDQAEIIKQAAHNMAINPQANSQAPKQPHPNSERPQPQQTSSGGLPRSAVSFADQQAAFDLLHENVAEGKNGQGVDGRGAPQRQQSAPQQTRPSAYQPTSNNGRPSTAPNPATHPASIYPRGRNTTQFPPPQHGYNMQGSSSFPVPKGPGHVQNSGHGAQHFNDQQRSVTTAMTPHQSHHAANAPIKNPASHPGNTSNQAPSSNTMPAGPVLSDSTGQTVVIGESTMVHYMDPVFEQPFTFPLELDGWRVELDHLKEKHTLSKGINIIVIERARFLRGVTWPTGREPLAQSANATPLMGPTSAPSAPQPTGPVPSVQQAPAVSCTSSGTLNSTKKPVPTQTPSSTASAPKNSQPPPTPNITRKTPGLHIDLTNVSPKTAMRKAGPIEKQTEAGFPELTSKNTEEKKILQSSPEITDNETEKKNIEPGSLEVTSKETEEMKILQNSPEITDNETEEKQVEPGSPEMVIIDGTPLGEDEDLFGDDDDYPEDSGISFTPSGDSTLQTIELTPPAPAGGSPAPTTLPKPAKGPRPEPGAERDAYDLDMEELFAEIDREDLERAERLENGDD